MSDNELWEHVEAIKTYCDTFTDGCDDCIFHYYRGYEGICVLNDGLYPNEWFKPQKGVD